MTLAEQLRQEGYNEGKLEGRLEGKLEGKLEGRLEGKLEGKREAEQRLLKMFVLNLFREFEPIEKISKLTGLSKERIEEIIAC